MTVESSNNTATKLQDIIKAFFAPDVGATAVGIVQGAFKVQYRSHQNPDVNLALAAGPATTIAGNVAQTHTLSDSTPVELRITSFKVTATSTITSANTNVAQFALVYNNGNGGGDTTIASVNTATTAGGGSGDITGGNPYSVALTAANVDVPSGSCLQIKVTKAGVPGKELPAVSFTVAATIGSSVV